MKLKYHPESDSPYTDLSERPGAGNREISEGVVLDYDASGQLAGIDIDNASTKVGLKKCCSKQSLWTRQTGVRERICVFARLRARAAANNPVP